MHQRIGTTFYHVQNVKLKYYHRNIQIVTLNNSL